MEGKSKQVFFFLFWRNKPAKKSGRYKVRYTGSRNERRKMASCVGRMGVGAYRRLLFPETWPPEPAWALDAHVEQFTVMEL